MFGIDFRDGPQGASLACEASHERLALSHANRRAPQANITSPRSSAYLAVEADNWMARKRHAADTQAPTSIILTRSFNFLVAS